MRTRMIPLMGQSKALLRIEEGENQGSLALSPPCPGGVLYLIGPDSQAFPAALDDAGRGSFSLPFSPVAALVYAGGGFCLSGGFAGRTDLLERAKMAVRLQAAAVKDAAVPPPAIGLPLQTRQDSARCQEAPPPIANAQPAGGQAVPQGRREACASLPTIQAGGAGQKLQPPPDIPPPPPACPPQDAPPAPRPSLGEGRRPQSQALLEALREAQELFYQEEAGAPPPRPSPAPGPVRIPNPFPKSFPQCAWRRISYPGGLGHYLSGEGTGRSGAYTVYALPGEYAPVPRRGKGFNRFLRATDGSGYWVRVVRKVNPPKS